jgi:MoaA/NifB/PqqE/SkfB family radical SAM enzyme
MVFRIWWIGVRLYKNPLKAFRAVRTLVVNFRKMIGKAKFVRAFKTEGKYTWDMFNPAWPSPGFDAFFRTHLLEIQPKTGNELILRRLLIAITKRCPLSCEHCSELDTLYQKDVLSLQAFEHKIDSFVQQGVGQLVYSGGEPLSRFEDLIQLIERYKNTCDQWIYTSAFGLTREKAEALKKAGLNGAAISLDHHLESEHNAFRGNSKSYFWVLEGIKNLQEVGILVSLNVCPTKEYIAVDGPTLLIELAKELAVPMVNFLEPRAVGAYASKDVELNQVEKDYLSALSHNFNFNKAFFTYPTVLFPAGFRKTLPCGGGRSYLLLDYDGTLYPCPFCKTKLPSVPKRDEQKLCTAS